MRTLWSTTPVSLCALAAMTLALAPLPGDAQSDAFTSEERAALLAGQLVRRDLSRVEGGRALYGGASWQRVSAPVEDVWRIATDTSALPRLIPSLDHARVIVDGRHSRIVYMHHSYGLAQTAYHVSMRIDEREHLVRFELDATRPHDIEAGRGYMRLTPHRGGTIVEWGMLVDPGQGVVMQLFGPMLSEWLLLPPRCMRDAAEGVPRRAC